MIKSQKKIYQNISIILLGALLLFFIGKNIPNICTVWELADEAGYLSNAAYFLGYDWGDVRASIPYYAYGYSVFLIPAFWLCNDGVALIRSACVINVLFVVGIYFAQIYLMKKLFAKGNSFCFAIIAFIVCLNPFLVSNALKVNCETLLALWVWILGIFLFQSIKSGKKIYYFLLGLCSAYTFFIHTRGIVIIIAVYLVLFLTSVLWKRKDIFINMVVSVLVMGALFCILYMVKNSILNHAAMMSVANGKDPSTGNLLTGNYLLDVFKRLFFVNSADLFVKGISARLFYTAFSSGTIALFGIVALVRGSMTFRNIENDNTEEMAAYSLKTFFLVGALLMILAVTINGLTGVSGNYTYFFYSRYYEFAIIPLITFGCLYCILENHHNHTAGMCILISIFVMCLIVLGLSKYLDSLEVHVDTNRIAGMTSAINHTNDFREMILYATLLMALLIVTYFLTSHNKMACWLYIFVASISILQNSSADIDKILSVNDKAVVDTKLVQTWISTESEQPVYMVDTPYKYDAYYSQIQVLLKNKKLNVISREDLENISSGSYFFTYSNVNEEDQMLYDCIPVGKGNVFNLYQKK